MKTVDEQLVMSITNTYQIGSHNRQPICYVYVHNRFLGDKDDVFLVPFGRLPGVMSVATTWDVTATAGGFTIVCQNKDGLLSPDYYLGKTPMASALRGHLDSPWRGQLQANTKIEIHWGYGEHVTREMTGLIDSVEINAAAQTLTIRGRSMKKLLIDNTVTPLRGHQYLIPYESMKMEDAINRVVVFAGLTLKKKPIIDPDTGEEYLVAASLGKRGDKYYEIANPLVESVFHYLHENAHGEIELREKPRYSQHVEAVEVTLDDAVNITDLDYSNNDVDIYGTLLIEAHSGAVDAFSSAYIVNRILNQYKREKVINYAWTTTKKRRELAASSEFVTMLHRFRTISVKVLADPRLELYDTVRIQERISTAQWNYHIKSIQTDFTPSGFTQQLGCASNFQFREYTGTLQELNPGENPDVTTEGNAISIGIWDIGAPDLDVVSVMVNGEMIAGNVVLKEEPQWFNVTLNEVGRYEITVIGVSAGRSDSLHFGYAIKDEADVPVYSISNVEFPRTSVNKYGYYKTTRPQRKTTVVKTK